MPQMKHGEYVGPDPLLREHKALLKSEDWTWDTVMAQFDTVRGPNGTTLTTGDLDPCETPTGPSKYLFGWHQFKKSEFKIEDELHPERDPRDENRALLTSRRRGKLENY